MIPKLANAKTGDTLTAPDFKVKYDAIRFPQPLYTVAMEAVKKGEEEKLASAVLKSSRRRSNLCSCEKSGSSPIAN